jgi:hypothetical protein
MPMALADASFQEEVCVSLTTEWRVWEDGERANVDVSVRDRSAYVEDPDTADVEVLEVLDALHGPEISNDMASTWTLFTKLQWRRLGGSCVR